MGFLSLVLLVWVVCDSLFIHLLLGRFVYFDCLLAGRERIFSAKPRCLFSFFFFVLLQVSWFSSGFHFLYSAFPICLFSSLLPFPFPFSLFSSILLFSPPFPFLSFLSSTFLSLYFSYPIPPSFSNSFSLFPSFLLLFSPFLPFFSLSSSSCPLPLSLSIIFPSPLLYLFSPSYHFPLLHFLLLLLSLPLFPPLPTLLCHPRRRASRAT